MPKGGDRAGRPGGQYSNRTDLAMGPRTAGHMAAPGGGGPGTTPTDVQEGSMPAPQPPSGGQAAPPGAPQEAPPMPGPPPGSLTPLDAEGAGGQLIDNQGRTPIFPPDPDARIRRLYQMTGHPDLLELLERRGRR